MNYRNYSQKSNFTAGSEALELLPFYLTTVNLPGITFNLPEVGGRQGAKVFLESDTITYNDLSFGIMLDEDYSVYREIMDIIFKNVDVESGKFTNNEFDFWIEVNNSKGNKLLKYEFYNCKFTSISDLELDTTDDNTEGTFSVDIKFDYYKLINEKIPTQNI